MVATPTSPELLVLKVKFILHLVSPQSLELSFEPRLFVLEAEESHAVLHEAKAILVQDGEVLVDKVIEDGVVGIMVS